MSARPAASAVRAATRSSNAAAARPANRTENARRPVVAVVNSQKPRSNGYRRIVLIIVAIVIGVVATIMINSQMAADAHRLEKETAELSRVRVDNDILRNQLKAEQSAPQLAKKAKSLGLVPAGESGTINLRDNSVKPGKPAGE